jgi:hypothetical protein
VRDEDGEQMSWTRPPAVPRGVPRLLALGRTAIGVSLLARPELLVRGLGGDSGTARRTGWLARMFAVREVALGVGTLVALRPGTADRPAARVWLAASAVTDAVDAGAMVAAVRARQVSVPVALLGAGTATGSVAAHLAAIVAG